MQPFSVRGDSPNKQLAGRLLEFLKANRASFEAAGFAWRGDEPSVESGKIKVPDWLKEKKLTFLVQNGLEKHPLAPDVPWSYELADTPDKKAMVKLISSPLVISRPYLAPPGLPAERAADIRNAFSRALADPGFIAEFETSSGGDKPEPTDGAAMQKILASMQATPKNVVERMRTILNP